MKQIIQVDGKSFEVMDATSHLKQHEALEIIYVPCKPILPQPEPKESERLLARYLGTPEENYFKDPKLRVIELADYILARVREEQGK